MGDNHDEEKAKAKTCRFSGEPCIGEACEQWVEIGVFFSSRRRHTR